MDNTEFAAQFENALALHRAGQTPQALEAYRTILRTHPDRFDVLHMAGVATFQMGDAAGGAALLARALEIDPGHAAAHNNYAAMLERLGRLPDALESYSRAIALNSAYVEALGNRGNVYAHLGQYDKALSDYDAALTLRSDFADAWSGRGNALRALGRHEAALFSYNSALRLQPGNAALHNNRGIVLAQMGRPREALASYDTALAGKSDSAVAHYNRGNALLALEQFDEALASYARAAAFGLDHAQIHNNRGNALRGLRRFDEALASYAAALTREPAYNDALQNRAAVYGDLGRHGDAIAIYDQILAAEPSAGILNAKGMAQSEAGRWEDAVQSHLAALALKADDAESRWTLGISRLRRGDFDQGWRDYEARWQADSAKLKPRHFSQPLWLGEAPLKNKTILLHAEQGLGDTLQFCRYVSLVADHGARVVLEVQPQLRNLLSGLAGVSQIVAQGEPLPPFDLHCPLMSLPHAFGTTGTTIPKPASYLEPPAEKLALVQDKLGPRTRPRIGFVWSGNPKHKNDRRRSVPLDQLIAAMPVQAHLFSFQKDLRPGDQAVLSGHSQVTSLGEHLHDFTDTAAYCAAMDLIVSVDTSLAHLAAALGKPTWILLPFNPDWRWLLDRRDSPWYDAATLYRQNSPDDWASALNTLKTDLSQFCAS
jgi:tetratricopeptide (TPR) repeat protein